MPKVILIIILDYASDMEGSKKEGITERKKARIKIAEAMLKEGISIDIIANCTKLIKEEIENLKYKIYCIQENSILV